MEALKENKTRSKGNNATSSIGKEAVGFPSQTFVQAQLETTQPGDSYEQEADATANLVMRKINGGESLSPSVSTRPSSPSISCFGGRGLRLNAKMESQLNSMRGGGHAMPDGLRSQMESGFGRSFSNVRLHSDSSASELSSSLQAKAFTHGNDIYFGQGQYNPSSQQGQSLIAHELTHTVQQSGKVAREEDYNYCSWADFNAEDYNYSSEEDFNKIVKSSNLDPIYYKQLQKSSKQFLLNHKFGDPISVAFIIDSNADYNKAADELSVRRSVNQNLSDKVISLHGDTVGECEYLLKRTEMLGPLQNLILVGHGDWDGIVLSENSCFTIDPKSDDYEPTIRFFRTVDTMMSEARNKHNVMSQSIFLEACLTNSHKHEDAQSKMNFKEVFNSYVSGNVKFFANSAKTPIQDVSIDSNSGALDVHVKENDKERNSTVLNDIYEGTEPIGRLRQLAHDWLQTKNILALVAQIEEYREQLQENDIHRLYLEKMLKFLFNFEFIRLKPYTKLLAIRNMLYLAEDLKSTDGEGDLDCIIGFDAIESAKEESGESKPLQL